MPAALDALAHRTLCLAGRLPAGRASGGPAAEAHRRELICLAVARCCLGVPNDRQFLALARWRLGHLFPQLIDQSGYNKRLRALAPQIGRAINYLAYISPPASATGCGCSTRRRCPAASRARPSAGRSSPATPATATARSHSRWFWGFRLYLFCAGDGMPIGWELAAANIGERHVAAEMLDRVPLAGHTVIADKGFAGREFEQLTADLGCRLAPARPQRRTPPPRQPRRRPPMDRIDLLEPAKANSASNATAPAPSPASSPASPNAYSPSPPASGTTTTPNSPPHIAAYGR